MAEQLYFSRDSKMFVEFDNRLWEVPVLDGFSFSQSTNQSEISLSEMQGADGLSRRGNRVFTDSLAPAEWSFSTYARPYQNTEHGGVEEVLWAVMAGADKYVDASTGGGLKTTNTADANPDAFTMSAAETGKSRTNGVYSINDNTGATTSGGGALTGKAFEIEVTVTGGNITKVQVISGGNGFSASDTIKIPGTAIGGATPGDDFTLTVKSGTDGITTEGASFYRNTQQDPNSPFGPAVIVPGTSKSTINFGQSNRSTLGECNIYFIMETSTTIPLIYKLENAAVNEASIDFEVDGIATINWSGFAKNVVDMTSSLNTAAAKDKAYVINVSSPANIAARITAARALSNEFGATGNRAADPGVGSIIFNRGNDNEVLLVTGTTSTPAESDAVLAITTGVDSTTTFIRNRLTQLLVGTTETTIFPSGSDGTNSAGTATKNFSLTLTGGNITISNNISYLVPEELGAVNVPIEHVTGGRVATGNFTCYLTFDDTNEGSSVDLFNDMVGTGLNRVVNNFEVTFQIGGSTGTPRLNVIMPKVHINVPSHSIEDVISVETNFASYTDEFNVADEVRLEYIGPDIT